MTYQLTSLVVGLALGASIFWLVRSGHLHGPRAFWWLGLAIAIILFGLWPQLTDVIARYLGVSYPPILVVILGLGLLFIKMMTMDLERTRQEQRLRRLAQRLAMLEALLESKDSAKGVGEGRERPTREHHS